MLWTERVHQCIIFQTFECSNESSPNSSRHSWNHKARVYSNFAPLFNVMKDNSSVFFSSNLTYTLNKNRPSKRNLGTLKWLVENSQNSSCHIRNYKSVFLETLHHSSVSRGITLLYFFRWNFVLFWQKEPMKGPIISDFWFHQILTLTGSFCWKYIKFQLKKYREVVSHDTDNWLKIWKKIDFLFQNW